jgi:hypothetical protein
VAPQAEDVALDALTDLLATSRPLVLTGAGMSTDML